MMQTLKICSLFCFIPLCFGPTSQAGVLNDHPNAYDNNEGPGTGGRWAGTVQFTDHLNNSVFVDFAVFKADAFNDNFSGLGYVPTDELVYVYQVLNTGWSGVDELLVTAINDVNNVGQFDIGDVASSFMESVPAYAVWVFLGPPIFNGESSWGLAFSSSNTPEFGSESYVANGGIVAFAQLPVPSTIAIPEPRCMALMTIGVAIGVGTMRRVRMRFGKTAQESHRSAS